jgi:hypothetical protein
MSDDKAPGIGLRITMGKATGVAGPARCNKALVVQGVTHPCARPAGHPALHETEGWDDGPDTAFAWIDGEEGQVTT